MAVCLSGRFVLGVVGTVSEAAPLSQPSVENVCGILSCENFISCPWTFLPTHEGIDIYLKACKPAILTVSFPKGLDAQQLGAAIKLGNEAKGFSSPVFIWCV